MEQIFERKLLKTSGFALLTVLLFGLILVLMISSDERWYAYPILAACVSTLILLRRTKLWHGWLVPLFWIVALTVGWIGLFAGQPSVEAQPYTNIELEQPSAPYQLLLNNVTVVDTLTGELTSDMSILCADGKIKEIAPSGTIKADEGATVVDAAGKYVVPGYLDMHMHMIGNEHTPEAMELLLASGITGFRQMSGSAELLAQWHAGDFTSSTDQPALLAMPGDILTPFNAPAPEIAVELVRLQKDEGADFIKVGGLLPEVFNAVQEEANKLGIPYVGHVLPDIDLKDVSEDGFYSVEHFGINHGALISCSTDEDVLRTQATAIPEITANPIFVQLMKIKGLRDFVNEQAIKLAIESSGGAKDEDHLQKIIDTYSEEKAIELADKYVENGTWQCPTIVRVRAGLFTESSETTAQGLNELYLQLAKTYASRGVKMLVGTDAGSETEWRNAGYSIHEEFDEFENAGISPLDVLQMATLNGAEYLGRLDDMGTVEVGKNADLVLLDANPIESVQNLHEIDSVIRAGDYHGKEKLDSVTTYTQP